MKKSGLKILSIISFSAFLLLSSCGQKEEENGLPLMNEIPVAIQPIAMADGMNITEGTGIFSTDDETLLSFKNGGIIQRIYVKEGDFIRKGQVLASLNTTEINARVNQVKLALEKAERDLKRAKQLYLDSVATKEQYENAQTAYNVYLQDWEAARFNLKHSDIHAPADGYVLMKLSEEGQIVGPGMPLFRVNGAGKGSWIIKVGVSDKQWVHIQKGDSAIITSDAFSEEMVAKVIRKSEGLNPQSGTFTVEVQPLETKDFNIASGMFAKVRIMSSGVESWQIPYEALLDGDGENGFVFVTNDKVSVQKVPVKIGNIDKDYISVVSGLENYSYLIVSGSPYLKENSKIKVVQ